VFGNSGLYANTHMTAVLLRAGLRLVNLQTLDDVQAVPVEDCRRRLTLSGMAAMACLVRYAGRRFRVGVLYFFVIHCFY